MPILLSLDTSTKACSVALHRKGQLLANVELLIEHAHSENLTLLIQECIKHARITLNEVDAFAVAMGPGSYTGLRIGVSTVKGLCYALDKPLIAINTLEAMASQLAILPTDYWYCPMLDARRMEVYCAIYDNRLQPILSTRAEIVNENSFGEQLAVKPILFFGDGAAKCKPQLARKPNAHFVDRIIYPSAKSVGMLAIKAFTAGQFENIAYFEPFYLKDFVSRVV